MHVIFSIGTASNWKYLGRVADYCWACSKIRPHRLFDVTTFSQINAIPLSRQKHWGYEIRCEHCGTKYSTTLTKYSGVMADTVADLNWLIPGTNPKLEEQIKAFAERAERNRDGNLTLSDRRAMILEAMLSVEPRIRERGRCIHFDAQGIASIFIMAGMLFISLLAEDVLPMKISGKTQLIISLSSLALGLMVVFWTLSRDIERFIRNSITPDLIRKLSEINPIPDASEVEDVLSELNTSGLIVGKLVSVQTLTDSYLAKATSSRLGR